MNLHDWIDELSDLLDLETEVDEGLLAELAEVSRDNVDGAAGPVTTYLLGYAAGKAGAGPATIERLAGRATELAESWDKPAEAEEPDDGGDLADDDFVTGVDDDEDDED